MKVAVVAVTVVMFGSLVMLGALVNRWQRAISPLNDMQRLVEDLRAHEQERRVGGRRRTDPSD